MTESAPRCICCARAVGTRYVCLFCLVADGGEHVLRFQRRAEP